jgi:hypothetical protein
MHLPATTVYRRFDIDVTRKDGNPLAAQVLPEPREWKPFLGSVPPAVINGFSISGTSGPWTCCHLQLTSHFVISLGERLGAKTVLVVIIS